MKTSNQKIVRNPSDGKARFIREMLRKLEMNPHCDYQNILNTLEYNEAKLMMRAAVAHVQARIATQCREGRRERPPSCFTWDGKRYPLKYSSFGRVFIANNDGVSLIGSSFFVI